MCLVFDVITISSIRHDKFLKKVLRLTMEYSFTIVFGMSILKKILIDDLLDLIPDTSQVYSNMEAPSDICILT